MPSILRFFGACRHLILIFALAGRRSGFYLAVMRCSAAAVLCFLLALMGAGEGSTQGLQVDLEEFRRLAGEVADLRDANLAHLKRIANLQKEVEALREALRNYQERSTAKLGDFATREDLKKIVNQIKEVDQQRESDRKLILNEFENLGKTLGKASRQRAAEETRAEPAQPFVGTFYEYEVKDGDGSLSQIQAAFNAELAKQGRPSITLRQIQQANPKLNVNRIFVGQKIQLPVPDQKK
jgi:uncharacterized protein YdiU (UPF0061 family)